MLSLELGDKFPLYLRESMREGIRGKIKAFADGGKQHGAITHIVSQAFKDKSAASKELLFNQKQLLGVAEKYLEEKPWITYFAATKHIIFMRSKGITSASFSDFRDKEYIDEVEKYAERIAVAAEGRIDSETQEFLHELIQLQRVEPLIDETIAGLKMLQDMTLEERRSFLYPVEERQSRRSLFQSGGARSVRKLEFGLSSAT